MDLRQQLWQELAKYAETNLDFSLERPIDESFGDWTTNLALIIGQRDKKNPRQVAEEIIAHLKRDEDLRAGFSSIEAAGPGFINFTIASDQLLATLKQFAKDLPKMMEDANLAGEKVVVEYTDPNPFKVFHIGHLMTNNIGEAIAGILEAVGAKVRRVCYQGDVGMHVAKSVWGLMRKLDKEKLEFGRLADWNLVDRIKFLGQAYALGDKNYRENEPAKAEINQLNKKIYDRSDSRINECYDQGRQWSLDYFETIYKKLGTHFDHYYFESQTGKKGKEIVEKGLKQGIFKKSEGAVIYEAPGLHTRVFLNSMGLPTYEAKDLGLAVGKYEDWSFDQSIIVTAAEITEYFKVVLSAMERLYPDLAQRTQHLPHGVMKLTSGKMSSRSGNIISGVDLIEEVTSAVESHSADKRLGRHDAEKIAIGAIKIEILKHGLGKDIVFDPQASLSLEGDTGPYLLYSLVRARKVLSQAKKAVKFSGDLKPEELALARWLNYYPDELRAAAHNLAPNLLVVYLFELGQKFNSFYNQHRILQAEVGQRDKRLFLTQAFEAVLGHALGLLAIPTVEAM